MCSFVERQRASACTLSNIESEPRSHQEYGHVLPFSFPCCRYAVNRVHLSGNARRRNVAVDNYRASPVTLCFLLAMDRSLVSQESIHNTYKDTVQCQA